MLPRLRITSRVGGKPLLRLLEKLQQTLAGFIDAARLIDALAEEAIKIVLQVDRRIDGLVAAASIGTN